jgi:hypothetical protein
MTINNTDKNLDSYFTDLAKNNIDDALTVLISDQDKSAEEVYMMLVTAVKELYEYFNKPAEKCATLLELMNVDGVDMTPPIKHLEEDEDQDLETHGYIEEKGSRSVKAVSYELVIDAFREYADIDIRIYKLTASLDSIELLQQIDGDTVQVSHIDIRDLWFQHIAPMVSDYCKVTIRDKYASILKNGNKLPSGNIYTNMDIACGRLYQCKMIFDLVYETEQLMNVQMLNMLKIEKRLSTVAQNGVLNSTREEYETLGRMVEEIKELEEIVFGHNE